jgi:hypothetical protein
LLENPHKNINVEEENIAFHEENIHHHACSEGSLKMHV